MNRYDDNWYHPIYSHLYREGEYLYRAERDSDGEGKLYIEKYDDNWKLLDTTIVEYGNEYIWGGLHIGELYNFLIVGQTNYEEDNNKTVFKIIKYDKTWNKTGELDIKGANTVDPFEAGTLRCTESNGYLYITTCHKMYTFYDGLNHQANVLIVIDEENMTVIDQVTGIVSGGGYVSHSFNQFIEASSDGSVYRIDQGDAYPRGIIMTKVWKEASSNITFQEFAEAVSESMYDVNKTGAQIAGLKESGDGFAIAYIYDDRGGQADVAPNYIYVMNIPKELIDKTSKPPIVGLKFYNIYGDAFLYDGPLMSSLGKDNGGVILWNEKEKKYTSNGEYNYFDEGNKCFVRYYPNGAVSEVYSFSGKLSDCEPINVDGKIIWYVADGDIPEFYILDPEELTLKSCFADGNGSEDIGISLRDDFNICSVYDTPQDIINDVEYEEISDLLNGQYSSPDGSILTNLSVTNGVTRITEYTEKKLIHKYTIFENGSWSEEKRTYDSDGNVKSVITTKSFGKWERKDYEYVPNDDGQTRYETTRNNSGSWKKESYKYNIDGQCVQETFENNNGVWQKTDISYHENGKKALETISSSDGVVCTVEYDDKGNKIKETEIDGDIETISLYKTWTIEKENGYKTTFYSRLCSTKSTHMETGAWQQTDLTYDDNANIIKEHTYNSKGEGRIIESEYDSYGRLIKETGSNVLGEKSECIYEYEGDVEWPVRAVKTLPDGTVEIYEADEYGWLQLVEN
jgi:hypothetical protein